MKKSWVGWAALALAANLFVSPSAFAVDGCALVICLVDGADNYKECADILMEAHKDAALGKPPPKCKRVGGGNHNESAANEEQYNQAQTGATAVKENTATANPYGDSAAGQQYQSAQTSAATAALNAQTAVDAGARTADTSQVDSSANASTAQTMAPGAQVDAQAKVDQEQAACITADCEITNTLPPDPAPQQCDPMSSDFEACIRAQAQASALP